jgi:RHS repeat-associated protein
MDQRRVLWQVTGCVSSSVSESAGSTTTSFLRDGLNSTVALTNLSATTTATYWYSAYGDTAVSGTGATTLGYTGRENDGATGLYYYRARYYSPQLGRFISEDPLGLGGGANFYAYAFGDPVDYRDPSGKCPWCAAAAVVGAVMNAANNYSAYESGQISGFQYFEDIAVGAGTGYLSGLPGGYIVSTLLGAATASANEGIQELVNGHVNPCKIGVATLAGSLGGLFAPVGESIGEEDFVQPVIGSLIDGPFGYTGAGIGFGLSLVLSALPIPDWVFPEEK